MQEQNANVIPGFGVLLDRPALRLLREPSYPFFAATKKAPRDRRLMNDEQVYASAVARSCYCDLKPEL